jgi:hypothetical protein
VTVRDDAAVDMLDDADDPVEPGGDPSQAQDQRGQDSTRRDGVLEQLQAGVTW